MRASPTNIANLLLSSLPEATLERLQAQLFPIDMARGQVLAHVDGPIKHMYFVNCGLVSLVKTMRDGRTVEIETVGIEGVTDPNALFGVDSALLESVVQIPGSAYRISRDALQAEIAGDPALRGLLQRYMRFAIGQIAQTAACNRLHSLEERCCRWLLIAHDSALADRFPLTHEFLAMMLGVHRSGVSIAANFLKKAGLIDYTHGYITIIDRSGLEEAACECYDVVHAELDRLFVRQ